MSKLEGFKEIEISKRLKKLYSKEVPEKILLKI